MSFFRNLRSSISRSKNSSRDTSPARHRRAASVASNATGERRDSIESKPDSVFNRSDTFILEASDADEKSHSNTSTLEKKTKKSKVLSKFSTFTKRKKTPSPSYEGDEILNEHHPSENATNTYYHWKNDANANNADYDANSDPFHFLYEPQAKPAYSNNSQYANNDSSASFDSGTYRKGKISKHLREQLVQMQAAQSVAEVDDEQESDSEKYKTITLDSFRKSFRDKYLNQQNEVPHNPSWFVEVPKSTETTHTRPEFKENRNVLVFDNDNFRPQSRSPVRERSSRTNTRSPVKRNETFKVTRSALENKSPSSPSASIRIEFKNSITPARNVPVGVAKPMPTSNAQNISPSYLTQYATVNEKWNADPDASSKRHSLASNASPKGVSYLSQYVPVDENWKNSQENIVRRQSVSSNASQVKPTYLKQYVPVAEHWQRSQEDMTRRQSIASNAGQIKHSYLKQYVPANEFKNLYEENTSRRISGISSPSNHRPYLSQYTSMNPADNSASYLVRHIPRETNSSYLPMKSSTAGGRYQTTVHIANGSTATVGPTSNKPRISLLNKSTMPSRVQQQAKHEPAIKPSYLSQYAKITPRTTFSSTQQPNYANNAVGSKVLSANLSGNSKSVRHTYFGDSSLPTNNLERLNATGAMGSTKSKHNQPSYNSNVGFDHVKKHSKQQHPAANTPKLLISTQRRSRSPIKMPWR